MKHILVILIIIFSALPAYADEMQKAKRVYSEAAQAFGDQNFEKAAKLFKESYNLSGKPEILFNLALTQEKLGQTDRAIAYYQLYLEELPDADDADEVKEKINHLQNPGKPESAETAAVSDKPDEGQQADDDKTGEKESIESKAADRNAQQPDTLEIIEDDKNKPVKTSTIIQGVLIGTGTLLFASGGLTAIAAYKKYNSYESLCAPDCSQDKADKVKSMSIAADIMMGTGIAALTAGIVWLVVDKKKSGKKTGEKIADRNGGVSLSPFFNGGSVVVWRTF